MTYYIDPIWFYLIGVCGTLDTVTATICVVVAILSALFVIGIGVFYIDSYDSRCEYDAKTMSTLKKYLKTFLIATIVFGIVNAVIPSKETCEEMMIASVITHENVDDVKGDVKELVDYVFDNIEGTDTDTED